MGIHERSQPHRLGTDLELSHGVAAAGPGVLPGDEVLQLAIGAE